MPLDAATSARTSALPRLENGASEVAGGIDDQRCEIGVDQGETREIQAGDIEPERGSQVGEDRGDGVTGACASRVLIDPNSLPLMASMTPPEMIKPIEVKLAILTFPRMPMREAGRPRTDWPLATSLPLSVVMLVWPRILPRATIWPL